MKFTKVSEILIAAKAALVHDKLDFFRMSPQDQDKHDYFICHALMKVDGSYGAEQPESEVCRRAREVVLSLIPGCATYVDLASALHGSGVSSDMPSRELQAGRHRYLDFLIAEFKARGE